MKLKFFYLCNSGRLAAKIARKDSLALKLAMRPDRQELIDRNIIRIVTDKEVQETKEAIGAKLIRYAEAHIGYELIILRTCITELLYLSI